MDQVLNLRPDTYSVSQKKTQAEHSLTQITEILSYLHPRVMKMKPRTKKWDLIKLKSFCIAKEIINKMKRQPTEQEKIFLNEVTYKRLISKIQIVHTAQYQENKPSQKMGRRPKHIFLQRRHIDGPKAHEKVLNLTNNHGNANQNYNKVSTFTVRKPIIKKSTNSKCQKECGEKGNPSTQAGM